MAGMVVGQVVSVLAFYSDNLIRNPASLHFLSWKHCYWAFDGGGGAVADHNWDILGSNHFLSFKNGVRRKKIKILLEF